MRGGRGDGRQAAECAHPHTQRGRRQGHQRVIHVRPQDLRLQHAADMLVELDAAAAAMAQATVCVGPDHAAAARAFVECKAPVLAFGIVKVRMGWKGGRFNG